MDSRKAGKQFVSLLLSRSLSLSLSLSFSVCLCLSLAPSLFICGGTMEADISSSVLCAHIPDLSAHLLLYSGVTLNVARPDMNNYATLGVMLY